MYKTIKQNITTQIVEKKSKFIANLYYAPTIEDAENILQNIKKQYYDAKHNCYAYRIKTQDGIISKSSDDGEPSGTAGAPMLNIITKNELVNVLIVVTRYFGGILLGTGGLVKAYSEVLIDAIKKATFVMEQQGVEMEVIINYNDFEKLNYYCNKNLLTIVHTEYNDKIKCIIEMNEEEKNKIIENINNLNFKIESYKIISNKNIRKNLEKKTLIKKNRKIFQKTIAKMRNK